MRATLAHLRGLARVMPRVLRRVIGAPDYDAYLAHMRQRHPERAPLEREAYARERLAARYDRPGARCC